MIRIEGYIFYEERPVKCGKTRKEIKVGKEKRSCYRYLFEDVTLRAGEGVTLYKKHDKGEISKEEINAKKN